MGTVTGLIPASSLFAAASRVRWSEGYEHGAFDDASAAFDLLVVPSVGLGNPPFELER